METKILAINISDKKGTSKRGVASGVLKENFGLLGDAHAKENSKRQVSILDIESIKRLNKALKPGDFAENITTEQLDISKLKIGDRLRINKDVILEITQIGKVCHTRCAIFKKLGDCIMPKEGIFARVLSGGIVRAGDRLEVIKDV
ncbi:MAG: MOSC domain-containing protein [Candidatus Omnitrophica bacterium]|nr:MOSC domain-containing protein [Candidatus Omnitrophota bacterium]